MIYMTGFCSAITYPRGYEEKSVNRCCIIHKSVLVGGQKRNRPRKPPVCWKCGEVGHVQHFCPKDRSLKLDHKAKAANKEVPFDSDGDGIFAAGDDLPQING